MTRRDYAILIPFLLAGFLLVLASLDHPFFWDTIQLSSRHAHHFYLTGFREYLLPDSMDSGHIPFTGFLLAGCWSLFGKTLPVSHFLMFPFVAGIVVQAFFLLRNYLPSRFLVIALATFLCDPVLLSQMSLVSPDVLLVFFFLLSINSILKNNRLLLSLGLSGMVLVSLRGMMISFGLFLIALYLQHPFSSLRTFWQSLRKLIICWLPAAFIAIFYLSYHYYVKGWIGYHSGSPWAGSFELVGFKGFIRNILILCWRLIDHGKLFFWILLLSLLFRNGIKKSFNDKNIQWFLLSILILLLSVAGSMLTHTGLMNHRYLLPVHSFIFLSSFYILYSSEIKEKIKWVISVLCLAIVLAGNAWVYPWPISTGWDSTMAHWGWYEVDRNIQKDLTEMNIPAAQVGAAFPCLAPRNITHLTNGPLSFSPIDTSANSFILWSNIMNDFPDPLYIHLKKHCLPLRQWKKGFVKASLYTNPWK